MILIHFGKKNVKLTLHHIYNYIRANHITNVAYFTQYMTATFTIAVTYSATLFDRDRVESPRGITYRRSVGRVLLHKTLPIRE